MTAHSGGLARNCGQGCWSTRHKSIRWPEAWPPVRGRREGMWVFLFDSRHAGKLLAFTRYCCLVRRIDFNCLVCLWHLSQPPPPPPPPPHPTPPSHLLSTPLVFCSAWPQCFLKTNNTLDQKFRWHGKGG